MIWLVIKQKPACSAVEWMRTAFQYGYDALNRFTEVSKCEEQLRAFTFDAANRMRNAYEIKDGIRKRAEYTYNAFGYRIGQDIYSFGADNGILKAAGQKPQNPKAADILYP